VTLSSPFNIFSAQFFAWDGAQLFTSIFASQSFADGCKSAHSRAFSTPTAQAARIQHRRRIIRTASNSLPEATTLSSTELVTSHPPPLAAAQGDKQTSWPRTAEARCANSQTQAFRSLPDIRQASCDASAHKRRNAKSRQFPFQSPEAQ
jgi:hypothetical protein